MAGTAMTFTIFSLICACVGARVVRPQGGEIIKKMTGSLYFLDSLTGDQERLRRGHVENAESHQYVRLELGSEGQTIDMALRQRSVWSEDSKVVVRRGDDVEEVPVAIRTACYLAGRLTSDDGVASLNYCDGLTGMIHTRDADYLLEEMSSSEGMEPDFKDIAITVLTPSNDYMMNDDVDEPVMMETEDEERDFFSNMMDNDDNTTDTYFDMMNKRASSGIAAEVGVYVDRYFANYLKSQRINTAQKVTNFMINKWNTVAEIYGNRARVGINFDIQLKLVEVWWKNPSYYERVQADQSMSTHLRTFCDGTKYTRFDHRMLYTLNVGGNVMGLAYVNGVCNANSACSVVKSKTSSVRVEIHEFGHSLGFAHEPKLQPCSKPDGFMGWANTYKFNDCYKRVLLQNLKSNSKRCLYVRNLSKPVLN